MNSFGYFQVKVVEGAIEKFISYPLPLFPGTIHAEKACMNCRFGLSSFNSLVFQHNLFVWSRFKSR
jgi:hypothetical protein